MTFSNAGIIANPGWYVKYIYGIIFLSPPFSLFAASRPITRQEETIMNDWVRLTKTDNRPVDVNMRHAQTVLRDERNYGTLISFGPSDTITVLETPDQIVSKGAARGYIPAA